MRRVEGIEAVCRFDAEAEAELAMAAGFCKLQFAVGPTALEGAAQDSSKPAHVLPCQMDFEAVFPLQLPGDI